MKNNWCLNYYFPPLISKKLFLFKEGEKIMHINPTENKPNLTLSL